MLLTLALLACQPDPVEEAAPAPTLTAFTDEREYPITELASQALAMAPAWLRPDLELTFQRLHEENQDTYAALIVDLDEPWLIDEVAFSIAHLSIEMLEDRYMEPGILVENAEWVYRVDDSLAYVEIVDVGEPGVDDDFYSTARYKVEVGGAIEEIELDRDTWYWYVVHPRIEDERTWYIDGFDACNASTLECPRDAEGGMFWRRFLWEGAAETCPEGDFCPVLSDHMADAQYLWSDAGGGVGAVGAIASFMLLSDPEMGRWLSFGAGSERSIQPNRIYGLGAGNCGEWADMTTALSRLALIPNINVAPSSWDHTWNEFYDPSADRWVPWEPVNWWFDHAYGAPFVNYATRGDAMVFDVTDNYTTNLATLAFTVTDADGAPVDGALVSLWSPYDVYYWYAGEAATGPDGTVSFEVSADVELLYRVDSPIGSYPEQSNRIDYGTEGVAAGTTETLEVELPEPMATLPEHEAALPAGAADTVLHIGGAVDSGRTIVASMRYNDHTFSQDIAPPTLRWFLTDSANYQAYRLGDPFEVVAEGLLGDGAELPFDPAEDRVLLIVNGDSLATAAVGSVSLRLSPGDAGAWTGELSLDQDFALMPGDHLAFDIAKP